METVAADYVVAQDLINFTVKLRADRRAVPVNAVQRNIAAFESKIAAIGYPLCDQILYHLLLAVNCHAFPGELHKRNAVTNSVDTNLDPVVAKALSIEPLGDSGLSPRGLRVIESFDGHRDGRSIVEIGQSSGLSRAAIRRILYTLESLGYVERSRQVYRLKSQVLRLGFSFLSSSSVIEAARPVLERITEQLHESSSMSMLDGGQIVYVARCAASRILAAGLSVGSRLPAYCTSMGRVLLASLPDDKLNAYLRDLKPRSYTPKTLTRISQIKKAILQVRKDGYAIVDEELEAGLRSIAVPVITHNNQVVSAINVGTHVTRVDRTTLIRQCLPALQAGARSLRSVLI